MNSENKTLHMQTIGEEIANAVTHGIGAGLSIAGLTLLVVMAALFGNAWHVTSVSIYGATLVFLYLASTLYHSIQFPPAKQVFHIMDHIGIAFLIAGTYTPILLITMRDMRGWIFFVLIWSLAVVGALLKAFFTGRYTTLSTMAYILMGWLSLFLIRDLLNTFGPGGLAWIAAGGVAYSLGVIAFLWRRLPFNHAIWHLFVIAGSACHFVAIYRYVLPIS